MLRHGINDIAFSSERYRFSHLGTVGNPYSWLKEFVDTRLSAAQIGTR
jgi:hypothetical protein